MNMVTIGTILKDRIKEKGYTQEEFCELVGIGLSSLKKYMNGKVFYSIDTLELFANALDCSYDYLLGKSKTPKPELHEVKELTRLQDKAIEYLQDCAKEYDSNDNAKRFLDTLSTIISEEFIVDRIIDFLYIDDKEELLIEQDSVLPQPGIYVGKSYLSIPDIEDDKYYQIVLMLIYNGVRISELLDLKKENVHLEEQYFDVIDSKTENGIRKVPIANKVLEFYKGWFNDGIDSDYLLHTDDGKHFLYRNYYDSYFKPLMKNLYIERTPHCCRHTCISMLADARVDQTTIKKIVGHAGAMTLTEKVYTHMDIGELVKAINLI